MVTILFTLVSLAMCAGMYFGLRKGKESFVATPLTPDARLSMYFMSAASALGAIALLILIVTKERPEFLPIVVFSVGATIWTLRTASKA